MKKVAIGKKQYNSTMTESKGRHYCFYGILCGLFVLYLIYFAHQQTFKLTRGIFLQLKSPKKTGCHIMQFDPMDESIKHLVKTGRELQCPKPDPLTYMNGTILFIDSTLFPDYNVSDPEVLRCCWSKLYRPPVYKTNKDIKWDNQIREDKCRKFQEWVQVNAEFILVTCTYGNTTVYKNFHYILTEKQSKVSEPVGEGKESGSHSPSVLMVGVDSASRLNFHRQMPLTKNTLLREGAVEFVAYNKVGDNTLPNFLPLLTGLSQQTIKKSCWHGDKFTFDNCPFLWKNFSEKGYVTMYAEDEPSISVFNYRKRGFRKQPTDHYLRTLLLAGEKYLHKTTRNNMHVCYGPSPTVGIVMNYTRDFLHLYQSSKYFVLSWSSTLSHQDMNDLGRADKYYNNFFQDIFQSGIVNNTIIIFLSDHGMRWGKIRETIVGWMENRVPFLFVWIPPNIRVNYPQIMTSLLNNTETLISPYDIHETLKDILRWDVKDGPQRTKTPSSCPKCHSLFKAVPKDRTCDDAGIDEEWCACVKLTVNTSRADAENIALMSLDVLNRKTKGISRCARFGLEGVLSSRAQLLRKEDKDIVVYVVQFTSTPGRAMFEAMARRGENKTLSLVGSISRINEYSNQSWCVDDYIMKLFCYCV